MTRAGRAKSTQVKGDKFARMSDETYATVAEVVALTGLPTKRYYPEWSNMPRTTW